MSNKYMSAQPYYANNNFNSGGNNQSPGIDWSQHFAQQNAGDQSNFLQTLFGNSQPNEYAGGQGMSGFNPAENMLKNPIELSSEGFDWNQGFENFGNVMQGLNMGMSAYTGLKGLDMAKKQFKFQKKAYNTNLQNQYQDLNRGLEGKYRDLVAGGNAGDYSSMDDYVNKNKFG